MKGLRTLGLVARAGSVRAFEGPIAGVYSSIYHHASHAPRRITTAAPEAASGTTAPKPSANAAAPGPFPDTAAREASGGSTVPSSSEGTAAPEPRGDATGSKPSTAAAKPEPSDDDERPLPERFRALMRLVPQPVVVCTAVHPSTEDSPPKPQAMTVSSLTSLSLDPTPLLTFNMSKPSRTLDAVQASGRFNVHVLADSKPGKRVAEWFANPHRPEEQFKDPVRGCGCSIFKTADGLVLGGRPIRRFLKCRVVKLVGVRDHVIVIGEVLKIDGHASGMGLGYVNKTYGRVESVFRKPFPGPKGRDLHIRRQSESDKDDG